MLPLAEAEYMKPFKVTSHFGYHAEVEGEDAYWAKHVDKELATLRARAEQAEAERDDKIIAKDLIIAELQSSIDGCARRVAQLRAERDEARSRATHWESYALKAENHAEKCVEERNEARRLTVWIAKNFWGSSYNDITYFAGTRDIRHVEHDGTDAGILAALRKAKEMSGGD